MTGTGKRGPNAETLLVIAIQQAVVATRRALLFRNNVGMARFGDAHVRYGLGLGSADLVGLLVVGPRAGRFVAMEVKTPLGRASSEQLAWATAITRALGFHAFVRSVPDALAALDAAEVM